MTCPAVLSVRCLTITRSKILTAVIMKRLGFGDDVIVEDYMKSKDNLMPFLREYCESHPDADLRPLLPSEKNLRPPLAVL